MALIEPRGIIHTTLYRKTRMHIMPPSSNSGEDYIRSLRTCLGTRDALQILDFNVVSHLAMGAGLGDMQSALLGEYTYTYGEMSLSGRDIRELSN